MTARKVVVDDDIVAGIEQMLHSVAADVPGPSRYQHLQFEILRRNAGREKCAAIASLPDRTVSPAPRDG